MSSFLLSQEEFQNIADWLFIQATSQRSRHAHYIKTFIGFEPGTHEHANASKEEIEHKLRSAMRHLYNLNRLALVTRYSDAYEREDLTQFTPKHNPLINERKAIETLISLRYQCGEYIVMETETYKKLDKLIGKLCEVVFSRD